jgi:hypothetical protein
MKIHTGTDCFQRTRSGAVVANVWLTVDDASFPNASWDDFAVVILSSFAGALMRLAHGSRSEIVHFMEGPFTVRLRREGSHDLAVEGFEQATLRFSTRVPIVELAETIAESAEDLLKWCRERKWVGSDEVALEVAVRDMKRGALGQ